jgi:hypothetical protein
LPGEAAAAGEVMPVAAVFFGALAEAATDAFFLHL